MSDEKRYAGVVGFVFKEPEHSTTKTEKGLRRVLVTEANSRNSFFSVTVWDENHGHVPAAVGDLVVAQGKYEERTKDGTTFKNISANLFVNLGSGVGKDDGGGGAAAPAAKPDDDPF